MTTKNAWPFAVCVALLMSGCGERHATTAAATTSKATQALSGAHEYKAGLDEYAAGRYPLSVGHFRKAAQLGNADGQYYTGLLSANGEGVKQSWSEAAKWYQKAAAQNQPDALTQLARLYVTGVGVGKVDLQKGAELFKRAADAYPPGENRDRVVQQREALLKAMASTEPASTQK
jgi:TPR repeat protein